ncbi:unnamed protein product [Merluccius merluccius]
MPFMVLSYQWRDKQGTVVPVYCFLWTHTVQPLCYDNRGQGRTERPPPPPAPPPLARAQGDPWTMAVSIVAPQTHVPLPAPPTHH